MCGYPGSCFKNSYGSPGEIIPSEFDTLIQKVAEHVNIKEEDFKELLVTEYPPGAVINWHRDAPPFDVIAGISLHSKCTFKLRPHDKLKQGRKTMVSLTIEPRSLYVIKGVARTDWEHSTAPVEQTRYSITLRTLRKM
jgi:alkylated DNA repair dioxygenase AlkB